MRLPLTFDTERLAQDLALCVESEWPSHFNTQDYSGTWTSIALYSATGNENDIATYPTEHFQPTPLMERCPYFREIVDSFQCEKGSVRLLNLAPGSQIHEHRDRKLAYEYGLMRLHIPVQTSEGVDFIVGGDKVEMKGGELWYANFDLPHSVHNRGEKARVHLVIDLRRNEWSDELFRSAGYDFEEEKRCLQPDPETQRLIMEQLALMDTDASRQLLKGMQEQNGE